MCTYQRLQKVDLTAYWKSLSIQWFVVMERGEEGLDGQAPG
jgi:hypothetical protein